MSNTPSVKLRPRFQGERLILRAPQETDKADRLDYGRDPEFRKMVGGDPHTVPPLTPSEVDRWYRRVAEDELSWIIEFRQRCIGTARLNYQDKTNHRASYSIGIYGPSPWGNGLGTEATRLVLQHAFEVLKLHRVYLRVLTFNERAIRCYEKCGFVREGIERESELIGGEWCSDLHMSILEQEYAKLVQ